MKKAVSTDRAALTDAQRAQLGALSGQPDTTDIPEAAVENWRHARRFFKPRKEAVSLRLDADVLDWLRHRSARYQSEINRILREKMDAEKA